MSKADEMFEKLGYKDKITDDFKIKYNNLLHKEQIVFYFQTIAEIFSYPFADARSNNPYWFGGDGGDQCLCFRC